MAPGRDRGAGAACLFALLGGAGNGARTRDIQLGRLTLCQLSYPRTPRGLYPQAKSRVKRVCHRTAQGPITCYAARNGRLRSHTLRRNAERRELAPTVVEVLKLYCVPAGFSGAGDVLW